jgi:hypothetical protein
MKGLEESVCSNESKSERGDVGIRWYDAARTY